MSTSYYNTLLIVSATLVIATNGLQSRDECTLVSTIYEQLGYAQIDVPKKARYGKDLNICPKEVTCCTEEMENNLDTYSRRMFDQRLAEITQFTRTSFMTGTANFNEFFLKLLQDAQSELDQMFARAYGLQYQSNRDVFNRLFADFQLYYKGGDISLNDAMNQFFKNVFLRMFAMQSPTYHLDDNYLKCVGDKMESLKPFGTIPDLVTKSVRQAFVAARTFVQGLAVGRNVAMKMANVQPTEYCSRSHTKQSFCSVCKGLTAIQPCNEYCVNVMKGCLAYHAEINSSWIKYIDAMESLAGRLEGAGSFNIEVVITPLKDMISEAIMEYHQSAKTISDQVFSRDMCGMPPRAGQRNKRGTRSKQRHRTSSQPSARDQSSLNSLVSDIKSKMSRVRSIWTDLPSSMCDGAVTASPRSTNCWNGESRGSYTKPESGNGLENNLENPEVEVSLRTPNRIVEEQIMELNKATKHLSNAKLGIDVDWLDFDVSKPIPPVITESKDDALLKLPNISTTRHPELSRLPEGSGGDLIENTEEVSGKDDIFINSGDVDTEDGDVEDDGVVNTDGSGWDSDIVHITPYKPGVKKPNKQHLGEGNGKKDNDRVLIEGSGITYNPNRPIAIPIVPTRPKPDNPYKTIEGSGLERISITDYDDEDRYIVKTIKPLRGDDSPTNIIQAGDGFDSVKRTTTPKSSASIDSHSKLMMLLSSIVTLAWLRFTRQFVVL